MPFRQAVHGLDYRGPFLQPSKKQHREAEERLDRAILAQPRINGRVAEAGFWKGAKEVEAAEEVVADLRRRKNLAQTILAKAEAFQRELAD